MFANFSMMHDNLYEPDPKELEKIYKIIRDIYVGQYQKKQKKKKKPESEEDDGT